MGWGSEDLGNHSVITITINGVNCAQSWKRNEVKSLIKRGNYKLYCFLWKFEENEYWEKPWFHYCSLKMQFWLRVVGMRSKGDQGDMEIQGHTFFKNVLELKEMRGMEGSFSKFHC